LELSTKALLRLCSNVPYINISGSIVGSLCLSHASEKQNKSAQRTQKETLNTFRNFRNYFHEKLRAKLED
jgi:hypothetical protein